MALFRIFCLLAVFSISSLAATETNPNCPNILVSVYSNSSSQWTMKLAEQIANGALNASANVRIRRVNETSCDDMLWSDGIALGSPVCKSKIVYQYYLMNVWSSLGDWGIMYILFIINRLGNHVGRNETFPRKPPNKLFRMANYSINKQSGCCVYHWWACGWWERRNDGVDTDGVASYEYGDHWMWLWKCMYMYVLCYSILLSPLILFLLVSKTNLKICSIPPNLRLKIISTIDIFCMFCCDWLHYISHCAHIKYQILFNHRQSMGS